MWVSVEVTPGTLLRRSATVLATSSWSLHPDHRDQVDLAGDGVDLADAVEGRDLLGDLGDPGDVGLHEHDGGDHEGQAIEPAARRASGRGARRTARGSDGTPRPRRGGRRGDPAPATGQLHSPWTSTSRTPGASSQRSTFSVSSAVAAPTGPRPGSTVSAESPQLGDVLLGVGAVGDHPRGGQPAVAHDVHLPPAVAVAPDGDQLGAAGERRQALGARAGADERRQAIAVDAGLLVALVLGEARHPGVDRLDHLVRAGAPACRGGPGPPTRTSSGRRCRRRGRGTCPSRPARTPRATGACRTGRCTAGRGRSRGVRPGSARRPGGTRTGRGSRRRRRGPS